MSNSTVEYVNAANDVQRASVALGTFMAERGFTPRTEDAPADATPTEDAPAEETEKDTSSKRTRTTK